MVKGLLGRKIGMTRVFTEDGNWIPVTVLEVGPCTVVQRKTTENDGYDAVQVGFGDVKEKRCNKPMRGHFAGNGKDKPAIPPKRTLREFRVEPSDDLKRGDQIRVDIFKAGELVDVAGISKGKGFQGVQKRHGFSGGPAAHGSMFHRAPGSIGTSATPSRTLKGRKLPGHMGSVRITVRNLAVVRVDVDKNLMLVRGGVPGASGGLVEVKKSLKGAK